MRHPSLSVEPARQGLEKRRRGEPWSASPYVQWTGVGHSFEERLAADLLEELSNLSRDFPDDALPRNMGMTFEALAAPLVHSRLRLDAATATSREFWLWLSFAACDGRYADIVDWRFGGRLDIGPENYGIVSRGQLREGLFARLWLRGDIGYDASSEDPYSLARRGDMDIWRSHVMREEYGRFRPLAAALIRYQYPDASPESRRLTNKSLRELAKRIRMLDATIAYETLEPDQLARIIEENANSIVSSAD